MGKSDFVIRGIHRLFGEATSEEIPLSDWARISMKTWILGTLTFPILGWLVAAELNQFSRHYYGTLEEDLAEQRLHDILTYLDGTMTPSEELNGLLYQSEAPALYRVKQLRKQLHSALALSPQDPALTRLAYAIRTQCTGIERLMSAVPIRTETLSAEELAQSVIEHCALSPLVAPDLRALSSTAAKIEQAVDFLFIGITHPIISLGALGSEGRLGADVLKFNAYHKGNYDLWAGTFHIPRNGPDADIDFSYGPTPTGSDTALGAYHHMKEMGIGAIHQSLLNPTAKGEGEKLELLYQWAEGRKHLTFSQVDFDTDLWRRRGQYGQVDSLSDFQDLYQHYLLTQGRLQPKAKQPNNGVFFPPSVLDKDIIQAVETTTRVLTPLLEAGHWEDEEIADRIGRQHRVAALLTQGLLTAALLVRTAQADPSITRFHFTQCCLNDVDRGPLLNQTTQLLFYLNQKEEELFSRQEAMTLIGPFFARPALQGRRMLKETYETFVDLLLTMGAHGGMTQFTRGVKDYFAYLQAGAACYRPRLGTT